MKSRRGDPHALLTGVGSALLSATLRPDMGINMDDFTPVALLEIGRAHVSTLFRST